MSGSQATGSHHAPSMSKESKSEALDDDGYLSGYSQVEASVVHANRKWKKAAEMLVQYLHISLPNCAPSTYEIQPPSTPNPLSDCLPPNRPEERICCVGQELNIYAIYTPVYTRRHVDLSTYRLTYSNLDTGFNIVKP